MRKHYTVSKPAPRDASCARTVYRKVRHTWYLERFKLYGYAHANKYAAQGCQVRPTDDEE